MTDSDSALIRTVTETIKAFIYALVVDTILVGIQYRNLSTISDGVPKPCPVRLQNVIRSTLITPPIAPMSNSKGSSDLSGYKIDDGMDIVLRSLENDSGAAVGSSSVMANDIEQQRFSDIREAVPQSFLKIGGSPDEDNLSSKIRYLDKKQVVMKRASAFLSREFAYNASTALHVVTTAMNPLVPDVTSIWDEAKEYLQEESVKEPPEFRQPTKRKMPRENTKSAISPVHPSILKIFTKTVARIAAGDFQKTGSFKHSRQEYFPLSAMKVEGSWVSDCLRSWTNVSTRNADSPWKISTDSRTQTTILIPPRGAVLPDIITIQEAVSFATEARLVVLAAPPFRVVHANRSFRLFVSAGRGDELPVVGRPLEHIVEVTSRSRPMQSIEGVVTMGDTRRVCQVRLNPVTEHSHSSERYLSHFVVSFIDTSEEAEAESSDSDANESYTVGAVG